MKRVDIYYQDTRLQILLPQLIKDNEIKKDKRITKK